MTIKHKFVSGKASTPDPDDIDAGKWNEEHLVDAAGIPMASSVAGAAAPASGLVTFAQDYAGRPMLAALAPSGAAMLQQTAFLRCRPAYWLPNGGSTTITASGILINPGTPTARQVGSLSFFTSHRRVGYVTAATPNANVNARAGSAAERLYIIGTVARTGGFLQVWRIGTSQYVNDMRCFFGMYSGSGAYGSASPSSLTDMIGIGFDAGDTVWSAYNNDSAGVPTKTPLGAGFPCNTNNTDVIEFAMRVAPGTQTVLWQATNLTTGATATGSMTTDLPVEVLLQPHLSVVNGPSGVAAGVELMLMYIETEN
jgi:hypothetical protein